jgi:hypothetical protein
MTVQPPRQLGGSVIDHHFRNLRQRRVGLLFFFERLLEQPAYPI